jgi:uncharacterized membrane protein YkvI
MNDQAAPQSGDPRTFLRAHLLDSYEQEYRELGAEWRAIEAKAQGTVTIAGVFIASAFAFLNQLTESTTSLQRLLLASGITGLVATVLLSVVALRVRTIYQAPIGEDQYKPVMDLLKIKEADVLAERLPGLQHDRLDGWKSTNEKLTKERRKKAETLFAAQVVLVVTLATIGMLAMTFIF